MADLLIENLPDELCCACRSMSGEERRLVSLELAASIRRVSRKRPELDDVEQYIQRTRERIAAGTLKPITDDLIDEAIAGRAR